MSESIDWAAVADLAKIFNDDDKLMALSLEQNDIAARLREALKAELENHWYKQV